MRFERVKWRVAIGLALVGVCLSGRARAAEPEPGPRLNPFACQGRAEALESDRTIAQIRGELEKRENPPYWPTDPRSVRALKLCTLAQLKQRIGDADAIDYYERAIREAPDEPGYELFAGRYYAGARGAKGPVLELAEKYFYRALAKLDALRAAHRLEPYHEIVEDQTRKQMLLLYQRDGLPLLPWKAYPQHPSGYSAPGLSIESYDRIWKDTRFTIGANELGGFTAETQLYQRRREPAGPREFFLVARNPARYFTENTLIFRHNLLGAVLAGVDLERDEHAAFDDFSQIGQAVPRMHDVNVRQLFVGFDRTLPLYPLFDLRLRAQYVRVHRVGLVEYQPNYAQDFPMYVFKPQISRFIGSDKLTISGSYALMVIPDLDGEARGGLQPGDLRLRRGRLIAGVEAEYAFYSPLLLPSLQLASLRPFRTPTRGLYLSAGYVTDNELFGDRRVVNDTIHGGVRLEGPGMWDVSLHESWFRGRGTDITSFGETLAEDLSGGSLRTNVTLVRHLAHADLTPGVPESVGPFASDSVSLAFPASWDRVVKGPTAYENFRVGTELWFKLFATGAWGATTLTTLSYEYQYFYHFGKHVHNIGATVRLGWGDL